MISGRRICGHGRAWWSLLTPPGTLRTPDAMLSLMEKTSVPWASASLLGQDAQTPPPRIFLPFQGSPRGYSAMYQQEE